MSFLATQPRFPASMPAPLEAGYTVENVDSAKSMEMDSGNIRRRAVNTNAPRKVTLSWSLSQAQFDALDAFYEKALGGGAETFAIALHGLGPGLRWAHAQFVEPFDSQVTDTGRYMVSAQLWVLRSVAFSGAKLISAPSAVADATALTWRGSALPPVTSPAEVPYVLRKPFHYYTEADLVSVVTPPILGIVKVGVPVTYTPAVFSGIAPIVIAHSIHVNGISMGPTYTPTIADVDKAVFVRAIAQNCGGGGEADSSSAFVGQPFFKVRFDEEEASISMFLPWASTAAIVDGHLELTTTTYFFGAQSTQSGEFADGYVQALVTVPSPANGDDLSGIHYRSGTTATPAEPGEGGIFGRIGYYVGVHATGMVELSTSGGIVYGQGGGQVAAANIGPISGQVLIRAEFAGDLHRIYVNGSMVIEVHDKQHMLPGYCGVIAYRVNQTKLFLHEFESQSDPEPTWQKFAPGTIVKTSLALDTSEFMTYRGSSLRSASDKIAIDLDGSTATGAALYKPFSVGWVTDKDLWLFGIDLGTTITRMEGIDISVDIPIRNAGSYDYSYIFWGVSEENFAAVSASAGANAPPFYFFTGFTAALNPGNQRLEVFKGSGAPGSYAGADQLLSVEVGQMVGAVGGPRRGVGRLRVMVFQDVHVFTWNGQVLGRFRLNSIQRMDQTKMYHCGAGVTNSGSYSMHFPLDNMSFRKVASMQELYEVGGFGESDLVNLTGQLPPTP